MQGGGHRTLLEVKGEGVVQKPTGRTPTPKNSSNTAPRAHAGVSEALLGPCEGRSSYAAQLVIC